MKRMLILHCAMLLCLLVQSTTHAADSTSASSWQNYRDQLLKEPGLVRYYTFDAGNGLFVVDQVAKGEASVYGVNTLTILSNSPYGRPRTHYVVNGTTPYDFPYWTTGRFASKSALATGLGHPNVARSQFYGTNSGDFSVFAWIRMHVEPTDKSSGTLFNCGSGWKEGWKVKWSRAPWEPDGNIFFELGTAQSKEVISAKPFTPGVWHCFAATWSKGELSLYVDGKIAAEKKFEQQQILWPQRPTDALLSIPYYDLGGLMLGRSNTTDGNCRTDFDELAIFDQALSAGKIAALFTQGKPADSPEKQLENYKQCQQDKTFLDQIKLQIPSDTFGYFFNDRPFEASVIIPPALGLAGKFQAKFTLANLQGQCVFDQTQSFNVEVDRQCKAVQPIALQRCGLYWLTISLQDDKGKTIKSTEYPLAMMLPLPAMKDVPLSYPLSCHYMGHIPEHAVLGNKSDRIIMAWPDMEPKKNEFNFAYEDDEIQLIERNGMNLLFCVDLRPPAWLGLAKGSKNLAADMTEVERFLRVLVTRYKGRVAYWEIFNEPNTSHGLQGPDRAKDYVTYLKLAYRVIKEVDPQAKVAAFSGVHWVSWFTDVMKENPGKSYDIVTLHNYGSPPIPINRERQLIQNVRKILDENGRPEVPIWNGECGFEQPARINNRPINDEQLLKIYAGRMRDSLGTLIAPGWMPMTTEKRNAYWQAQAILLDLAVGCEKYVTLSGGSDYGPDNNSDDGNPSEKGIAKAVVSNLLLDMKSIHKLPLASTDQEAILITSKNGKQRLAAFSMEPSALTLAVARDGTFTGMDYLGNPLSWQARNGVLQIPISEAPVYINDVPENINEKPIISVELAGDHLPADYRLSGKIKVTNPWTTELTLTFNTTLPDTTTIELPKSLTLKPGQQTDVPFVMQSKNLWYGWYRACISASTPDQAVVARADTKFYSAGSVIRVPLATNAITLDGNADDWPANAADGKAYWDRQIVRGKPIEGVPGDLQWRGRNDLSFNVKTTWRSGEGLYFLLNVTDDKIVTSPDQTQGYLYDGLELFVDTRAVNKRTLEYSLGAQQMLIYPQIQATPAPCKVEYCGTLGNTVSVKAVGKRTDTGYIIEGLIAPAAGYESNFTAGQRVYLDFNVNDTDSLVKSELRKSTMSLHSVHASDSTDTSQWGAYEMVGPGK